MASAPLHCAGELQLETPANRYLTLQGDGASLLVSAERTRDFLPLLGALRTHGWQLARQPPGGLLRATGLQVRLVVLNQVIVELGGAGNWMGRLLGMPGLRVNLLRLLRTL